MMLRIACVASFGFLAACRPAPAQNPDPLGDAQSSKHGADSEQIHQRDASHSVVQSDVVLVKRQTDSQVIVPNRTSSSDAVLVKRESMPSSPSIEHKWCGKEGWSSAAQDAALAIPKLKVVKGTIQAKCTNPNKNCHTTMNEPKDVVVESFQIDPELITHAAYRACVAAKQCSPLVSVPPPPQAPNYQSMPPNYPDQACGGDPVFFVTAKQAESYCRWQRGRLPTEPELRMAFELGIIRRPVDAKVWVEGIYVPANLGVGEILQGYYANNTRLAVGWYDGFGLGGFNETLGTATIGFRCVAR